MMTVGQLSSQPSSLSPSPGWRWNEPSRPEKDDPSRPKKEDPSRPEKEDPSQPEKEDPSRPEKEDPFRHPQRANVASQYAQLGRFLRCVHHMVVDTTNFQLPPNGENTFVVSTIWSWRQRTSNSLTEKRPSSSPPGPPSFPRYSSGDLHNQFPHLQRAS